MEVPRQKPFLARVLLPPGTYVSATCACGSTSDLPSDVLSAPEDARKTLPGFAARGALLLRPPAFLRKAPVALR